MVGGLSLFDCSKQLKDSSSMLDLPHVCCRLHEGPGKVTSTMPDRQRPDPYFLFFCTAVLGFMREGVKTRLLITSRVLESLAEYSRFKIAEDRGSQELVGCGKCGDIPQGDTGIPLTFLPCVHRLQCSRYTTLK